jgi:transcriptional regulator of acetoin/glycerol metabolism
MDEPARRFAHASTRPLLYNRENAERAAIQRALLDSEFSRARAARALGVSRVTLYKKMKKYGLMDLPQTTAADTK